MQHEIILKDKTAATIVVVKGPHHGWAPKISHLLGHKPAVHYDANETLLTENMGIDAFFYLVVQDDKPIANIKTMELQGVGILGDVYTMPECRGKGVATQLMAAVMDDFAARGGKALYLGTAYDSPAWHIYHKFGFRSIAPQSGSMAYFSEDNFLEKYFSAERATIGALNWGHYPTSAALFMAPLADQVRCLPMNMIGQSNSEGALLKVLAGLRSEKPTCNGFALQKDNGAVVGISMWKKHPLWPETNLVDVWCHPAFWEYAPQLLQYSLDTMPRQQSLAYADSACPQKEKVLLEANFESAATLTNWLGETTVREFIWEK